MQNAKELVDAISTTARAILAIIEELPTAQRKLLKVAWEGSSFVVGLVPGGAIVTLVGGLVTANNVKTALKERRDALRGLSAEEVRAQLERVEETTALELQKLKSVARAKEDEEKKLHHLQLLAEEGREKLRALQVLDEKEFLQVIGLAKQELSKKPWDNQDIQSIVSALHFEISRLSDVLKALMEFQSQDFGGKIKNAFAQMIQLRKLISERARLLRETDETSLHLVKSEEQEIYELSNTTNLLDAQVQVIRQHINALEALLEETIQFQNETRSKSLLAAFLPDYWKKLGGLRDKHAALDEKFQRSMEHLKTQYLDAPTPAENLAATA